MVRNAIGLRSKIVLSILSVLILVGVYSCLSYRQHLKIPDDTTIPTWSQMGRGFIEKAFEPNERSGERWIAVDAAATYSRLFYALVCSILIAVPLGVLMGCFPIVEALLVPPLSFCAKVPPTAALAVFFVMVGTGRELYLTMIAFGVVPTLAQVLYLSVHDVPSELLNKAYTIGASTVEVIWNVIFRHIFPKVLDAVRLQIGPAVVYLIAAEMVCASVGFGYRIRLQSRLLSMDVVYPYLLILAASGFALDAALRLTHRMLCPWAQQGKR